MEELIWKVSDGLYIGNYKSSTSKSLLQEHNITHILCVANEITNLHQNVMI